MRTVEKITKVLILVALFSCVSSGYAQKYWVGGQGKWSDVKHWSKTSGGVGGASVPTSFQDGIFDKNSGIHNGDTVCIDDFASVKNLNFSLLPFPLVLTGDSKSALFITGKVFGGKNFLNEFSKFL